MDGAVTALRPRVRPSLAPCRLVAPLSALGLSRLVPALESRTGLCLYVPVLYRPGEYRGGHRVCLARTAVAAPTDHPSNHLWEQRVGDLARRQAERTAPQRRRRA